MTDVHPVTFHPVCCPYHNASLLPRQCPIVIRMSDAAAASPLPIDPPDEPKELSVHSSALLPPSTPAPEPVRKLSPRTKKPKVAIESFVGDPWDRQPGESSKAYMAFTYYLKLDPEDRTVREGMERYNISIGKKPQNRETSGSFNTYMWSTKFRWEERASAYDSFMLAKEIAAQKRRRVKIATKHADDAAAVQEIIMLPVKELRERLAAQGGKLTAVSELDEGSLIKLMKAMTSDLPAMQRSEREALGSVSDEVAPRAELKAKGDIVRKILASRELIGMAEKVTFELTAEGQDDS